MQSWGVQSRFTVRDTGLEPSKSGVTGLLCAALGRPRDADVGDLAGLRFGARVDQEGTMACDYHTAQGILKADGGIKDTEVSHRYYLSDACFLAGLAGDDLDLLTRLHAALRDPVWPLYLGRKAFVPGAPIWLADGLRPGEDLETALRAYPYLGSSAGKRPQQMRLVIEDPNGAEVRPDQPLSFAERRFAPRRVRTLFIPTPPDRKEVTACTSPA
jgi:CRISPR system Cascade subunit CasD